MIGIYCIKNLINGKRYIGQSGNILRRWNDHISDLKNGSHRNRLIQSDFDSIGIQGFSFTVLEELEDRVSINEREQYWINKFKTFNEYNQQVSLNEENKDNVAYVPIEALTGINVSLNRKTSEGYVNYITYEIFIGLLNEYYKNRSNKIYTSINKIIKMRDLEKGRSTHKSCEFYFNKLSEIRLFDKNIIENIEYNPKYNNGNFVLLNSEFVKDLNFMPYNRKIFNSMSSAMSKHLYLLITLNSLKNNSKIFKIDKSDVYTYKDDNIFSYNKKVKNAFEELIEKNVILNYKLVDNSFYEIKL